jgi:hypothetical protein
MVLFIFLMCIPAGLYGMATFYNILRPAKNMYIAILIAILFASFEYIFKIPIIDFAHRRKISPVIIQVVWIILTLGVSYLVSRNLENTV